MDKIIKEIKQKPCGCHGNFEQILNKYNETEENLFQYVQLINDIYILGMLHKYGVGTVRNIRLGLHYLAISAKTQNNIYAQIELGRFYNQNVCVGDRTIELPDCILSHEYLTLACENDQDIDTKLRAHEYLGCIYYFGNSIFEKDMSTAISYYNYVACYPPHKSVHSIVMLGNIYRDQADVTKADYYYNLALQEYGNLDRYKLFYKVGILVLLGELYYKYWKQHKSYLQKSYEYFLLAHLYNSNDNFAKWGLYRICKQMVFFYEDFVDLMNFLSSQHKICTYDIQLEH